MIRRTLVVLAVLLAAGILHADNRAPLQQNLIRGNYLASTETIYGEK